MTEALLVLGVFAGVVILLPLTMRGIAWLLDKVDKSVRP